MLDPKSKRPTWVFGYGSLIYKVDFPYLKRATGSITGWQRRFWQGSHDHRGTPESPGRVVSLVPARNRICRGVAYLVEYKVFEHLDHREKNGYSRFSTDITFAGSGECVDGVLYVADRDNPAFLGPASLGDLADHIAGAHGPSGSNREYVVQLAAALRDLGDEDPHVLALDELLSESER